MTTEREEKNLQAAFTGMAADYDQDRFGDPPLVYFNELETAAIRRLLGDPGGLRIIDVGSGTGRIALPLARAGARVTAVDLTPEMTKVAREKARRYGPLPVAFCLASARQLPFRARVFDALTSVRMFHLIPKPDLPGIVREMASVVKPGGVILVEVNNAFYAGFMGLVRDFQNWLLHVRRGMNRTHVVYPWDVGRIFGGLGGVETHGVYLPLLFRLHRITPRLALSLSAWSSIFPLNYLSKNLIVKIRLHGGDAG